MPHRLEDRVPRDLRERDPLRLVGCDAEEGGHVVGDRFALPVVVRGEHELVRALERALQVSDVPLGVLGDLVDRVEPVVHVDAELALRQVPDVPEGSPDGVVAAQVLLDGLRLGGRFDDDEGSWHIERCFLFWLPSGRGSVGEGLRVPPLGRYHRPVGASGSP
jgi:hypothetical protein